MTTANPSCLGLPSVSQGFFVSQEQPRIQYAVGRDMLFQANASDCVVVKVLVDLSDHSIAHVLLARGRQLPETQLQSLAGLTVRHVVIEFVGSFSVDFQLASKELTYGHVLR